MTPIPAICLTQNCNTIFPSPIMLGGKATATFHDCQAGPCPKCGGIGKIPDGIHKIYGGKLLAFLENINDINLLKRVSNELRRELSRNKSPKSVKKKLIKKFPALSTIWNLIPETKQDAYAVIQILLGITMAVTAIGSCSKNDEQKILNQTNNYIYQEAPKRSPQDPPLNKNRYSNSGNRPIKI